MKGLIIMLVPQTFRSSERLRSHIARTWGKELNYCRGAENLSLYITAEEYWGAMEKIHNEIKDREFTQFLRYGDNDSVLTKRHPNSYKNAMATVVLASIKLMVFFCTENQHCKNYMQNNARWEALRQKGWEVQVVWGGGLPPYHEYLYNSYDCLEKDIDEVIEKRLSMIEALSG